jgi:hypothetical protein
MENKKIVDNIILVQESIYNSWTNKEKGMVVKLDMKNAFVRVRHSFLYEVLKKFGFNEAFIEWIRACIGSPWISPMVNGRPRPFFQISRGLRQGCLLSPLLYIIMAESLSIKLDHERRMGRLLGLSFTIGVKSINHSQFVDDTLLLGAASFNNSQKI